MQEHPEPAAEPEPEFIAVGEGGALRRIAVRRRTGTAAPGLMWLCGFNSEMSGTKAVALDRFAAAQGRSCVRFDYSGHGVSGGAFTEGTISRWLEESLAVFDACCRGPQVLVGSSMGGWITLLLTRELRRREPAGRAAFPAGLVLIAPAVDLTEELMWKRFPEAVKREITTTGQWLRPSSYSETPHPITAGLIEDGRRHLLLGGLVETGCPVRILQGIKDPDVPYGHTLELVSRLARDDVVMSLVKDGDHRLSRPQDIDRMLRTVAECCAATPASTVN